MVNSSSTSPSTSVTTYHQWSCRKIMILVVSVHHSVRRGGPHVNITMIHWTSLYSPPFQTLNTGTPLLVTFDGHHWRPVETFIGPHCTAPCPTSTDTWWTLKDVRLASYWNAFLCKIWTHLVIYPPDRSSPLEWSWLCPAFRHLCCFRVQIKARWNQQLCNVCLNLWPSDHQSVSLFPFHEVPCVRRPWAWKARGSDIRHVHSKRVPFASATACCENICHNTFLVNRQWNCYRICCNVWNIKIYA